MEWIIFFIAIGAISYYQDKTTKNNSCNTTEIDSIFDDFCETTPYQNSRESEEHITNNYYTQNIVNVQVNNNYSKSSSKRSSKKDHTEKIWNKMGYRVKYGETYSYKFYGNKIFTPDQVERTSSYDIKYSKSGLADKLLENTGSKKMAKEILVEQYGVNKSEAKRLVGYKR